MFDFPLPLFQRIAAFAKLDPLAGTSGMSSRVTHELSMGAGKSGKLLDRATAFLRGDLIRLRNETRMPQHPILKGIVASIQETGTIESLNLPDGEKLRLLQTAWEEAKTGLRVESRFLPIRDRDNQPFDGVVARLVRFRPPEETHVHMGLFVSPGIIETPDKFINRWERFASRGFDVFVMEMPGIHTNLSNPIPREKRFVSSHVASHTLAAAANEAALWMATDSRSKGLLMGGLLASHSTFMGMEAAVVLGHTLPFSVGLAMEGPRIHAGKKYNHPKYLVTKALAGLNRIAPSLFGRFGFPVSRPKPKAFMPEGDPDLVWQRELHGAGLSLQTYDGPLVFSVWPAQRTLAETLFAPDGHGHKALPKRLRIGIHPGDEEVDNFLTEHLMNQIDADSSRPNVVRVKQPAHSMGYFPDTDEPLLQWFHSAAKG